MAQGGAVFFALGMATMRNAPTAAWSRPRNDPAARINQRGSSFAAICQKQE
jgi:hypothetical protein